MSLVTRVSVAFLVALALALGGFSACLYYLAGLRLRLALDQELEATLDRFPDRPEGESGRVTWAIYDEAGRRIEGTPGAGRPMVLDGRDLGPLAVDVATTIEGPDGLRWRVLARPIGGGRRRRGPPEARGEEHRPGPPARDERKGAGPGRERPSRVLAAWASLEPVEAEIRSLAAILPLISLGLWALAAAIGRHFGRRALAPLTLMAESARTMPFDDCRLPSPGTRDELEDFARSFNGLLDRLHVALERQRQFTGQASHQLRTPLAALIAAIEVARRRPRTVEEHERVLDRLHDDAVRLWRVVEALLFLARADAEAGLPDLERLDLAAWAADHLRAWSGHERAADLRFEGRDGDPLWTRAHRPLLGQLLDNLLENACKYSEPGTPIIVRTWCEPDAVALAVEDRGCGIPAEDLPRVFEPFYRAESARRLGRAGVGLGLAVARRIAATHGGTITAESEPGRGSRFVVRLPRLAGAGRCPGGRPDPRSSGHSLAGWIGLPVLTGQHESALLPGPDAMALERLEKPTHVRLILSPDSDGIGIHGLAHLHQAGCAHHAAVEVERQTCRVPIETQEFDQPARLAFQVAHQFFVVQVKPLEGASVSPVLEETLIVGNVTRDVVPGTAPGHRRQTRSPARDRDVARISPAEDHPRPGPEQCNQSKKLNILGVLIDHAFRVARRKFV